MTSTDDLASGGPPSSAARSVLDHPLVSSRYFFPRPDAPADVVWFEVDGAKLACAAHRPHGGDAPLVVHFHGNGEVVADYVPDVADAFAAAGLDTLFVEYRGYGASTGSPSLVGMLGDVPAVLDQLDVPLGRVIIYGRSVGSIYAIEAAHRRPALGGLVIESGIADPLERVLLRIEPAELGVEPAVIAREAALHLDHQAKLRGYPGPVLVIHAASDDLVDPSHAARNAAWAPRSELIVLPRGDHNTILSYNLPAIVAAVSRLATSKLPHSTKPLTTRRDVP
jgi:pimeloyl-ACP methyl ester carboxylesterase